MVSWETSSSDLSVFTLFQTLKIFVSIKIIAFFLEILTKLWEFVNFHDCIGKIKSKSIRLQSVFILKKFEVDKKQIFF